ncbi:AAA family ATPase [Mollicutes bacterium LVI A0078]|nr:AAA family ATPase [Mollicutes bacterium LVI A0075]WOO91442.1 AAA family ATPase [Mollicutes bacterium LVI A0078]
MIFQKLIIKNYRQYKDIEFDFNEDINIIEAENGIGKSTFMSTIIFALYGIEQVRKSGLIEDMRYMANQDNVDTSLNSFSFREYMTEVTLILTAKRDQKVYEINRTLNNNRYIAEAEHNEVGYFNPANFEKVQTFLIEDLAKKEVDITEVTSLIPENIAPLLFFDGERINSIEAVINTSKNNQDFKNEIEKILNIETYEEALSLIRKTKNSMKQDMASKSNDREIAILQKECNTYEEQIIEKEDNKLKLMQKLEAQEKETSKYNELLVTHEESIKHQKERESLQAQLSKAKELEKNIEGQLFEMVWEVGPKLATTSIFKSLNEVLSTGKSIYEISGMEQKAVADILTKDKCICGSHITTSMRTTLEELKEVLPPESFESMLKSEINAAIDLDDQEKKYINLRLDYSKTLSEITNINTSIKAVSMQIKNINITEIKTIEQKRHNSVEYEAKYRGKIAHLEGELQSITNTLMGKQKELDEKLAKENANGIENEVRNVLEGSEKFLKDQIDNKRGNIRGKLEVRVNENIKFLMRDEVTLKLKNNLIPEVRFAAGSTSASSGQNVMISLAYLLGLMQIAKEQSDDELVAQDISYPIVMDGVTAKLDVNHTDNMVKNILEANTQVLFLANDQMLNQLEKSIIEQSDLTTIDDKLIKLKRDKDTNVTYKVVR